MTIYTVVTKNTHHESGAMLFRNRESAMAYIRQCLNEYIAAANKLYVQQNKKSYISVRNADECESYQESGGTSYSVMFSIVGSDKTYIQDAELLERELL